jgi:transposase
VAAVRPRKPTNDAEAICTAVVQPTMRFVPVKTEVQQAVLMSHRTRDFLVRQLTQLANAIRAHLGEFGLVVPKGVHNMGRLVAEAEAADLPAEARMPLDLLVGQFRDTKARIDAITTDLRRAADADETARHLQAMPGIGPITASVLAATLPDVSAFHSARDLSAWLGLTPKPHSSGGKERLGAISKMGNRYIRRLLYLGAMGVISTRKRADPGEDWQGRMLGKKPLKVAAIALANRMARQIWAMLRTGAASRAA